jgi:hypothetical protein
MPRISDRHLDELIENDGELSTGPINSLGVLRLALDLKELRNRSATALSRRGLLDSLSEEELLDALNELNTDSLKKLLKELKRK